MIADDGGQNVVEVVGDAAGQLADRLHLLALREVFLQGPLLGRVERKHDRVGPVVARGIGRGHEEAGRARGSPRLPATDRGARYRFALERRRRSRRAAPRDPVRRRCRRSRGAGPEGCGFRASGASRAKAALGRNNPPEASTEAIATGVELKICAKRTSAARKSSSPLISPGARLITSDRDGPGAAVAGKGDLVEDARGHDAAPSRLQIDVELLRRRLPPDSPTPSKAPRRRRRRQCR